MNDLEAFAKLVQALDLPHGIPSRDVIRRVLSALKVDAFQSCFACWLNSLRDAAKEKAGVNAGLKRSRGD